MPPTTSTNPATDLRSVNWRGVFFDGPQSDTNADSDEIPVWCVYVGNEAAKPIQSVHWLWSFDLAKDLAQRMARDRNLELIQDASPT
jgi:hypothetical protein